MGRCKQVELDCMYVDRDNDDNCSLNECKYEREIIYNSDGSFITKPIKTKTKTKNKTKNKNNK